MSQTSQVLRHHYDIGLSLEARIAALQGGVVQLTGKKCLSAQQIASVSKKLLQAFQDKFVHVEEYRPEDISKVLDLLSYEGFDPVMVQRHILFLAKEKSTEWVELYEDILCMLCVQHVKGNLNAKNFKSLRGEAKNFVQSLIEKYRISLKIEDKKYTVTFPRIAAAFPLQAAQIAAVSGRDFGGLNGSQSLPDCMKCTTFSALIPAGKDSTQLLLFAANAFATDMSLTVTQQDFGKMTTAQLEKSWADQFKYTEIVFRSNVMPQEMRMRALTILGFNNEPKVIYEKILRTLKYAPTSAVKICTEEEFVDDMDDFSKIEVPFTFVAEKYKVKEPATTPAGPSGGPVGRTASTSGPSGGSL